MGTNRSSQEWGCLESGILWGLGKIKGDKIDNIVATVIRQADGSWTWRSTPFCGNKPSRIEAMLAAERCVDNKEMPK